MINDIQLFYISYSAKTLEQMPEGYLLLDNSDHARDDWREYWPIRNFLLSQSLSADTWYGFLSPRFGEKTGLLPHDVIHFINSAPAETEVVTFSPQPDMGAFFLNVFEQEEVFQPGFTAAAQAFFYSIGLTYDLSQLLMDSRHIVFSNYQIARGSFWKRWLEINERLFAICEGDSSALKDELTCPTSYPGAVQRKVFLMERIASFILATEPKWRVRAYDTFQCAWSGSRLNQFRDLAVISDALKIAAREQGFAEYLHEFSRLREKLQQS